MKVDEDAVPEAFGRNEQAKQVFRTFFIAFAGLVLAEVVGPGTADTVVELPAGIVQ